MADEETPAPVKPGYKTTEFWLSLMATILSAAFASGALTNNTVLAVAGMAATVLTALGYKVTRAMVKSAAVQANADTVAAVSYNEMLKKAA